MRCVQVGKPNWVVLPRRRIDGRREGVIYLERSSPTASSGLPAPRIGGRPSRQQMWRPVLLGLSPRGVCRAAPVTRSAGALLPHPFTPYRGRSRGGTALCCTCRRASRGRHAFPLGSTVPCGVRTFLTAAPGLNQRTAERRPNLHTTPYRTRRRAPKFSCRRAPNNAKQKSAAARGPSARRGVVVRAPPSPSCRRSSRCRGPDRR